MEQRTITYEEFDKEFKPMVDGNGQDNMFDTFADAITYATEEHNITDERAYRYIWAAVDTGGALYCLMNGRHICNVLYFVVATDPWGSATKDNDDVHILVSDDE